MKWSQQYGKAFSITLGPFDSYVTLHHPDYAKTLVSSSGKSFSCVFLVRMGIYIFF